MTEEGSAMAAILKQSARLTKLYRFCGRINNQASSLPLPLSREHSSTATNIPCLSLWIGHKKKVVTKEGKMVIQELNRLKNDPTKVDHFIQNHVLRLVKSDLYSVLHNLMRHDQLQLSLKLFDLARKEIWYKPDEYLFRDMLSTLARNKRGEEAMQTWNELKIEMPLRQRLCSFIVRKFLDHGLPSEAMKIYEDMKNTIDPPFEGAYRAVLKGLLPYPLLAEKVQKDFQELFPGLEANDLYNLVNE